MKTILRLIVCALVLFGALVMPSLAQRKGAQDSAQQTGPHEAEFRTFYADLLKAVQANDKEKIADMIVYPVSSWSIIKKRGAEDGSVKDRADFIARYDILFTAYMRLHLPKAKLQSTPELWFTSWKDGASEYALEFKYIDGSGFKIFTFDVGAY
jgi:hypothetical protein